MEERAAVYHRCEAEGIGISVMKPFSGGQLLQFFEALEETRDYSVIGSFKPADVVGKCVYCNHCRPCPVGIDIGTVNKYYDLARNGDAMAAGHYRGLQLQADACIFCAHCNNRCPFGVDQSGRMREIADYFRTQDAG